jgi:hypothetical protein
MSVRQDTDGSLLPAVKAASRALVFLTVPWSSPERTARVAFRAAVKFWLPSPRTSALSASRWTRRPSGVRLG